MLEKRAEILNVIPYIRGLVVYWMSRDQRVHNNWALLYSQKKAIEKKVPLLVVFNLINEYKSAHKRNFDFMIEGLKQVEKELNKLNIPFFLVKGNPETEIVKFCKKVGAGLLVTDFSPLKIKDTWVSEISRQWEHAFIQVDAHNIVPVWEASNKQEYAAYTFRPKINKRLSDYLVPFEKVETHPFTMDIPVKNSWPESKNPFEWIKSGEKHADEVLTNFIENKLNYYDENRNDPNKNVQSDLSPYLHYGQISSQYVALMVQKSNSSENNKEAFLEELIVRKELSDNYCYYNKNYDSFEGFPEWAQKSLSKHIEDKREFLYSFEELDKANTHDKLWNASQMEMVKRGKMHGYMRMYWAKKILEWTHSPQEAQNFAIYLNDKYQLDGRDPNGYTGIAWSVGGVHDRAWPEREVFGKIRYMNYNGAKRKFDIESYIKKVKSY